MKALFDGETFSISISGGNGLLFLDMEFPGYPKKRKFRAGVIDGLVRMESAASEVEEVAMSVFVQALVTSLDEAIEDYQGNLEEVCNAQLEVIRGVGIN